MKSWKFLLLGILAFSFGATSFSQDDQEVKIRKDIGLKYEFGSDKSILLELRQPFAEKWKANFGVSYVMVDYNNYGLGQIIDVQDSIIVTRQSSNERNGADLRIGVSRDLKWPIFSVSADLLFGYRFSRWQSNSQYSYLVDGEWQSYYFSWQNDPQPSLLHVHSLKPAVMAGFHLNYPIGHRLTVTAGVTHSIGIMTTLFTQEIQDPLNEYPDNGLPTITTIDFDTRFSVGIRYSLGKEHAYLKKERKKRKNKK